MATHYIDPVDGNDGNDGLSESNPIKTWPVTFTANDTYLGKGGTTAVLPTLLNCTSNGVTWGSYGTGQHTLNGETNNDTSKTLRIAADDCTIGNINITGCSSGGAGHAVQMISGSNFLVHEGATFTGPTVARDQNSHGIDFRGSTPFEIKDFFINGFASGIRIFDCPDVTNHASIHDGVIVLNAHVNQAGFSAGLGVFRVTGVDDWTYNLHLYNNDVSNWSENAVDLAAASNVMVYNNNFHDDDGHYSNPSAIFMGNQSLTASGHIVYGNYIHDLTITTGNGIHSRGGLDCFVYGNVIINCRHGIYNGTAGSNDNTYANNYIDGCGSGIKNSDSTTGQLAINNIITNCTAAIEQTSGTITYTTNCFPTGTTSGTDGGGNITDDPLINSDYSLPSNSPCIGVGTKWWGTDPRPSGFDGEPFPDSDVDIGTNQSLFSSDHPANL